jgi:hypothetical protein
VRLAFLDSCQSGKVIGVKGGRRGPGFDIRVTDEITSRGYAIITSSARDELSQESTEIRGAFFTHFLVSGLRGAADASGDGRVTLSEAYRYAYSRTLARTSATVGGSQHPMYDFELRGRGEVVLTRTAGSGARIAVKLDESGRLLLLDRRRDVVVAEHELVAGRSVFTAVKPGSYTAYFLPTDGEVRMADAAVSRGERAELRRNDFRAASLESAVAKGGLFSTPENTWTHRLGVGGLWRLWPLEGANDSYGLTLHYRAENPHRWEPVARLTWTSRGDVGVSTGYHDVGLLAGLGYLLPFSWIEVRAELLAGYEHLLQDDWKGEARHTSGFDYLGVVGVEIPASTFFVSLDAGAGGRVFQVIGKDWVHRVDVQAVLSLGWKWSER